MLDGFSRYIVHCELRENMKEFDIELVIAKGIEKHPGVKPRIISDNGPQFIANDFKAVVREYGLTHVRTSLSVAPFKAPTDKECRLLGLNLSWLSTRIPAKQRCSEKKPSRMVYGEHSDSQDYQRASFPD